MKIHGLLILFVLAVLSSLVCAFKFIDSTLSPKDLPLDQIHLPPGFKIAVYAEVPNARSMVLSNSGTLFVGNRNGDKVYAVRDTNGDMVADKTYIIDKGLKMPNGVALKDGNLYVAAVNKIYKYTDIETNLANPPEPEVIYEDYPTERHHGWKYIAFGPDGMLYIPVGAPCNICNKEDDNELYASITRIDVDNPKPEVVVHGVRNTVGFDWDPKTSKLWFTDNGRDMMGDNIPPCELNVVSKIGQHFGYPFCHGGYLLDPEFGGGKSCADYVAPTYRFGAHVAPLGMNFYGGGMFPDEYDNNVFVAQHGSWNRSSKVGYKVMRITHDDSRVSGATPFAYGWLDEKTQKAWGRPVDVVTMPDGSILISDDYADVVYRVSYKG